MHNQIREFENMLQWPRGIRYNTVRRSDHEEVVRENIYYTILKYTVYIFYSAQLDLEPPVLLMKTDRYPIEADQAPS